MVGLTPVACDYPVANAGDRSAILHLCVRLSVHFIYRLLYMYKSHLKLIVRHDID